MVLRKKAPSQTLASLLPQWKKGAFHPVYLFSGPDTLQRDEATEQLQKHFLGDDDSGFNVEWLDGENANAGAILNAANTLAFMGGKRLVVVRRAQELSAAHLNNLADQLANIPENNCLVLLWDTKADARLSIVQTVKSLGALLIFWVPFENQLPRWVQDRGQTVGKRIPLETARVLLDTVGVNLPDLSQEIEKLSLYVGEKDHIDVSDVEALQSGGKTLQYMELDRAFWARDTRKALELLEIYRERGQAPEFILGQLVRCFRRLFLAKALLSEKKATHEELWDMIWIRTRQLQSEFLRGLSSFTWQNLLDNLQALLQAEQRLKTGRFYPSTDLSLLVTGLLTKD